MYKLTNIVTVPDLGNTPARVHRPSGTVFLNSRIWQTLSEPIKKFILLHEEGHYILQTADEKKADQYALNHFAGTEKNSLRKINHAISSQLDILYNPEHQSRYDAIVLELLLTDYIKFGNEKAYKILSEMKQEILLKLFTGYLRSKEIPSTVLLTEEEKEIYLTDFLKSEEMQKIMTAELINEAKLKKSDFSDFGEKIVGFYRKVVNPDNKEKIKGLFNRIAGNYATKLSQGLDVNVNPEAIAYSVNPVNELPADNRMIGKVKTGGGSNKPGEGGIKSLTEKEEKKKKQKNLLIIGGIVLFVAVVGLILYFTLRK